MIGWRWQQGGNNLERFDFRGTILSTIRLCQTAKRMFIFLHRRQSGLFWLLLLIGVIVIALDGPQILGVLKEADWKALPPALLFTALSYLAV